MSDESTMTTDGGEWWMPDSRERFDRMMSMTREKVEVEYLRAVKAGIEKPVVIVADMNDGQARKAFSAAYGAEALATFDALPTPHEEIQRNHLIWGGHPVLAARALHAAGLGAIADSIGTCFSWPGRSFHVVFVQCGYAQIGDCPVPDADLDVPAFA